MGETSEKPYTAGGTGGTGGLFQRSFSFYDTVVKVLVA
jgi:hypothetical protein